MNHYYYASSPSMNTLFTTSELISRLNTNTIASCVLGINKINKLPNLYNLSHTAILLLQKEIDFDYDEVDNLSLEGRQKLKQYKPMTMGQASRISGVNPADIAVLAIALKQGKGKRK